MNTNKIKKYLLEDMDVLRQVVSELNSWNGCLDHLEIFENDEEFFEMMYPNNPIEAVRAWHFGGSDNNWNDEYIRVNGYGNLETLSEYSYEQELKDNIDDIVSELIKNKSHVFLDGELEELLED